MKYLLALIIILSSSIIFAKTPPKDFMSKKIGIWVPALSEPEAKGYTLDEFITNAFRNVVSQDWEDTSDSWIITIKAKDPMTKKKSTIKMQFLKSDKVAGPRRIVMDGEDYPMRNASPLMHTLIENVKEKIGKASDVKDDEKTAQSKSAEEKTSDSSVDQILGKHCTNDLTYVLTKIDQKNLMLSVTGGKCNLLNQKLLIKEVIPDQVINLELKPDCKFSIMLREKIANGRTGINPSWICDPKQLNSISGCNLFLLSSSTPNPCD